MTLNDDLASLCDGGAMKEGEHEAFLLQGSIMSLTTQLEYSANDVPHEVFHRICEQSVQGLKLYEDDLTKSPMAHMLLKYLKSAFEKYLSEVPSATAKLSSAERYSALGRAFGIVGKQGKAFTEEQLMGIYGAFSSKLVELTNGHNDTLTRKIVTECVRAAYQAHYREPWSYEKKDEDTQKSRTQVIRRILKKQGCL